MTENPLILVLVFFSFVSLEPELKLINLYLLSSTILEPFIESR